MIRIENLSRREVLALGGGGLVIGLFAPLDLGGRKTAMAHASSTEPVRLAAMVKISHDDWVTVIVGNSEMGQGICTGGAMMVAEELDADWNRVRWEMAPNDARNFGRPNNGPQLTGGSSSVRIMMPVYRKAGAAARAMLIQAAAKRWGVPATSLAAEQGAVVEIAGSRRARFGELADGAALETPPGDPPLKNRKDWTILGTSPMRFDIPDKVNGRAVYGIDVAVPGLKVASVLRPPVFGATVKSFDADAALKVKGVARVIEISSGVAVVAKSYWAARKGRDALKVTWSATPHDAVDTETLRARFREAARKPGLIAEAVGDFAQAFAGAAKTIEAVYETPYLAHQTLEPQNMTARVQDGLCEVWGSLQSQTIAENAAIAASKLSADKVRIHTTYLGGGLGRRSEPSDVYEVVELAAALGEPVKIIWSREEDMRHDFYRPMTVNALKAGLDAQGRVVAWNARLAGQSIFARRAPQNLALRKGIDGQSVECAVNMPYAIPNRLIEQCTTESHVPVGFWRSVGSSQNLFVVESFIDELAHAAGKDPFEFRRALMGGHPRFQRVLETAAEKAGWGGKLAPGRGRGIAIGEAFQGIVAQVAELSVAPDGRVTLHKIVAVGDFGTVIHPDIVHAQMRSSVVTGLDNAFTNRITIRNGSVEQGNFHDNPVPRMAMVPPIETHVIASQEAPGGVGEPAVGQVAPAVANAIFAATGKRVRGLPITPEKLRSL